LISFKTKGQKSKHFMVAVYPYGLGEKIV